MRAALYTRISTEEQSLNVQLDELRKHALASGWTIALTVEDTGSGVSERLEREQIMDAARAGSIDVVLVWKLDRWGSSLPDLMTTFQELSGLGVGFIALTEKFDISTTDGKAMIETLAIFAEFEKDILRERIKAGIAQARKKGGTHGRPRTAAKHEAKIRSLYEEGFSKADIARKLKIGRASVIRILASKERAGTVIDGQPDSTVVEAGTETTVPVQPAESTLASPPKQDGWKLLS